MQFITVNGTKYYAVRNTLINNAISFKFFNILSSVSISIPAVGTTGVQQTAKSWTMQSSSYNNQSESEVKHTLIRVEFISS